MEAPTELGLQSVGKGFVAELIGRETGNAGIRRMFLGMSIVSAWISPSKFTTSLV